MVLNLFRPQAEKARKALLELQAESSAVQSSGHAKVPPSNPKPHQREIAPM